MKRFFAAITLAVSGLATVFGADQLIAGQPGWSPSIVARGEEREQIRATPIEQRPYRPLHFYGNTVRRIHYRGTPSPTLSESVALPARVLIRR